MSEWFDPEAENPETEPDGGEPEIITLLDDEGNEVPFEVLDEIEVGDRLYLVLREADIPPEEWEADEEPEVMIFRCEEDEDGGEQYVWEEDEDILQYVFDLYQAGTEEYDFGEAD